MSLQSRVHEPVRCTHQIYSGHNEAADNLGYNRWYETSQSKAAPLSSSACHSCSALLHNLPLLLTLETLPYHVNMCLQMFVAGFIRLPNEWGWPVMRRRRCQSAAPCRRQGGTGVLNVLQTLQASSRRNLRQRSRIPQGRTNNARVYPSTTDFTAQRPPSTAPGPSQSSPRCLQNRILAI